MQKGFALPALLIVALLLSLPVAFWVVGNDVNFSSSRDIKGTSSVNENYAKPGFSVSVISESDTWDLVEYLCKTKEECTDSLNSGKRWGTVSGGKSTLHQVIVETSSSWEGYEYMKYYVKPGWTSAGMFYILDLGDYPSAEIVSLSDGQITAEVVIAPLAEVKSNFYKSATFSDSE